MLTKDGQVKIIDFDSAIKLYGASMFINSEKIRGTAQYLAPECWTGIYSPASDIWALGVMLTLLLFFAAPFQGKSIATLKEESEKALELGVSFLYKM